MQELSRPARWRRMLAGLGALLPLPPLRPMSPVALALSMLTLLVSTSWSPAHAQVSSPSTAADAAPAPLRYRVVNLSADELGSLPRINSSGQVTYAVTQGNAFVAAFFDGKRVRPIDSLGGAITITTGINDSGQVSGYSVSRPNGAFHAFRWSASSGTLDLGTIDGGESSGQAINAHGDVVGYSGGALRPIRAFRWMPNTGLEDLGALADDTSSAVAVNDSGLVAGFSNIANGDTHAFAWTRANGIEDIGTLGGSAAYPQAVGARGEVAGYSLIADPFGLYHAFFWTRATGMRDIGTLNGNESFALAMSPQAQIAGVINTDKGYQRAITWTAATGMRDLGTFGGPGARAQAVNGKGQVVGTAMDKAQTLRAFLWSAKQGLADLNTRLLNAPAGLLLDDAVAIADNGAIVATSNAGLVLLRPEGQDSVAAPVVGPIDAPRLIRVGGAVTMQVAFNDSDTREYHRASLQWGDASMETAVVSEKGGVGTASATHVYRAPGVYPIIVKVTDAAGNTTTVKREVVVEAAKQFAAGSGALLSPQGANRQAPAHTGPAAFSFVAPGSQAASGRLQFSTGQLAFRSTSMATSTASSLAGTGVLNGKDGYSYALSVGAGANQQGKFALRIWHRDARRGVDVVDYDNTQTRAGARGTTVSEGVIALAP